ncbi:amino acid ABC transporter permease [Microlunatus soli]|uniref:Polar amino acid transport system permease protein n=1 Tax=Microlunatus soli TaxID=630515 RepID=A0A1H1ZXX8_9ACTN|nr:amino acid ABC transporter permease [Microlunatus soli]SDT38459.1 polar amino acid transport system permease protein [Microlunatus soli]
MSAVPANDVAPAAGRDVAGATHRIRWGQWIARVAVVLIAIGLIKFLITNEKFEWSVVWAWFRAPSVGKALWTTIWLSAVSMVIGLVFGVLVAVARMARNRLVSGLAGVYVWFFRGTPLLVQLIFWFNLAALLPRLSISIPFGPELVSWDTNQVITPVTAAILGLGLNEVAYMAEIIRGGLLSVDPGQREAAKAFGMNSGRALRRVVLPQAMRSIIPPTGNQLINMVKATAMVSVIAMSDLLYTVQSVYNRTFQTIPLLLVAVVWYLIVTTVLNIVQSFIEFHFSRGTAAGESSFAALVTGWFRSRRPAAQLTGGDPR